MRVLLKVTSRKDGRSPEDEEKEIILPPEIEEFIKKHIQNPGQRRLTMELVIEPEIVIHSIPIVFPGSQVYNLRSLARDK